MKEILAARERNNTKSLYSSMASKTASPWQYHMIKRRDKGVTDTCVNDKDAILDQSYSSPYCAWKIVVGVLSVGSTVRCWCAGLVAPHMV